MGRARWRGLGRGILGRGGANGVQLGELRPERRDFGRLLRDLILELEDARPRLLGSPGLEHGQGRPARRRRHHEPDHGALRAHQNISSPW
jgi:hypothetical protein